MGKIGEEYDAGWYFGQNYASSLSAAKNQWGQWITGEKNVESFTQKQDHCNVKTQLYD